MTTPPKRRGHHASLDYHRRLLDDSVRMDAYERAIRALVSPGDVVLDIGCGTGILSMLAARRGAARVHAVEVADVAGVAKQLVAHNGLDAKVLVHHADLVTMAPEEPVDLVIGEFMGRFLIDDLMLDAVEAARQWLKPAGRFCPSGIALMLAPVGDIDLWSVNTFHTSFYGLDFSPALPYALNYCYQGQLSPKTLLGEPATFNDWSLASAPSPFEGVLTFEVERRGLMEAFAGWFEATLAPSITLSTAPGIETHWGQYLFPLPACYVERGDKVTVALSLDDASGEDPIWRWQGEVCRGAVTISRFDLESAQRLGERSGEGS